MSNVLTPVTEEQAKWLTDAGFAPWTTDAAGANKARWLRQHPDGYNTTSIRRYKLLNGQYSVWVASCSGYEFQIRADSLESVYVLAELAKWGAA